MEIQSNKHAIPLITTLAIVMVAGTILSAISIVNSAEALGYANNSHNSYHDKNKHHDDDYDHKHNDHESKYHQKYVKYHFNKWWGNKWWYWHW
jgi:hypothetical protein